MAQPTSQEWGRSWLAWAGGLSTCVLREVLHICIHAQGQDPSLPQSPANLRGHLGHMETDE